jgi:3-hydroxyacyl-[acyl-carrier protein] dehydratase / trans-2-decenoyl-[acyl-carrier protein] isomerase
MHQHNVYNWPAGEIFMDKQEIELVCLKQHPMLNSIGERKGITDPEDSFSLPLPYMLAFDNAYLNYQEKTGKYGKGYAEASLEVQANDPWFYCHFLGDPIMPGSQGLDAYLQLGGLWAGCTCEITGRARALSGNYVYQGQIFPFSKKIFYRIDIIRLLKKKRLLFFDGYLAVDRPDNIIYTFSETKMGFYTRTELSIPYEKTVDYYQPDWEKVRASALQWINEAELFYAKKTGK